MQQLGLVLTLLLSAPVLAKPLHTPRLQTSVTPAQTQENSYYLPIEFNLHPVDHSSTHVIGYQIKLQATMALHAPDLQQWSRSETILIGADIDDPTMQQRELCPRDLSPTHKDGVATTAALITVEVATTAVTTAMVGETTDVFVMPIPVMSGCCWHKRRLLGCLKPSAKKPRHCAGCAMSRWLAKHRSCISIS